MELLTSIAYLMVTTIITARLLSAEDEGVIHFRISENEPPDSFVGSVAENMQTLENVSSEIKTNALFTYLHPKAANNIYFTLNSLSGILTTSTVNIDREIVCPYKVECILELSIAVRSVDGFFDVAPVSVEILDMNDNEPNFPNPILTLNISENVAAGAEYPLDTADDPDMWGNNSIQSYDLVQSYDIFDLQVFKDRIGSYGLKLILKRTLDREIMDFYSFNIIAKDGGEPIKTGVLSVNVNVLDSNDNSPVFEKDYYNVTVKESIAPGTVILKLSASDADLGNNRKISYRFSERQSDIDIITGLFEISETTGELSVIHDLHLEQSESFEFYVEAFDHGDPPSVNQTVVLVRIEDAANNAPIITLNLLASDKIGFVNLSEAEKQGAFVAHINVEDTDKGENGNVSCRSENHYFGTEKLLARGYKIVTVKLLDRETLPLHDVIITCFDNGTPSLSSSVSFLVSVDDANDNAPKFDKAVYQSSVYENNNLGDKITKVIATDNDIGINKKFEYVLHSGDNSKGSFTINNITGDIYAADTYDRETNPFIVIRVLAIDQGSPRMTGTTTVTVTVLDRNDNIPHILPARPKLHIMENLPQNTSLGFLSGFDDDEGVNSKLIFSVAPVSAVFPFELSPDGEFRTKEKLNRELQNRYEIPVTVSDMGAKPLSNTQYVTISVMDENDNAPIVTFPNDANDSVDFVYPAGLYNVLTSVAAYDVDDGENSTLTYSIIEGNELGIFEIDSNIGEISIRKFIDIQNDISVSLLIKVQDRGVHPLETTASLTINLIYANATHVPTVEASSNKYIVISVVVVIATILLAIAIIGIILFLRSIDRTKGTDGEDGSAGYSDSGISSNSDSQTRPPGADNGVHDGKKKKKEVSFSMDFSLDGLDGGRNVDSSTDSGLVENRFYDAPPSYHSLNNIQQEKIDSHMKALKLQQYLWEAKSREWEHANMQVQTLPLGDSESETSRETITCDSGRGGSEDDVSTSSPNADDIKSFGFSEQKFSGKHVTFKAQHCAKPYLSDRPHSVRQSTPVHGGKIATKQPTVYRNSSTSIPRRDYTANDTKLVLKNFQQFNNQNTTNNIHTAPVSRSEPWRDYFKQHTCNNQQYIRHDSFSSVRSNDDDGGSTTTSGSYTLEPEEVGVDMFTSGPSQLVVCGEFK